MFFALLITAFSFKILKSNQVSSSDTTRSVVIENSNFQSRQFSNANSKYKSNRFTNALISNSNFKFKGAKDQALLLQLVNFNNNTIELDEDFESSPVELESGKSTIYNLTLKNLKSKDNDVPIISFKSTDIEFVKLKCEGTLQSTLFKGPVAGFSLTDSTIQGFSKDNKHQIRSAIFLSHITCTDGAKTFNFNNNLFTNNQIPVFELDTATKFTNNVSISKCQFINNAASSGSCVLVSSTSGITSSKIIIDTCTFTENKNLGSSGIISGALQINTNLVVFSGKSSFKKNYVYYEGDSSSNDAFGGFGASIYIKQGKLEAYTIEGLEFEEDTASDAGASIFIYGYDDRTGQRQAPITIRDCTFRNCHSEQFGGAISTGIQKNDNSVVGNNDITITNCVFTSCDAGSGGAIYVPTGTASGGEETIISDCRFEKCSGSSGSAVFSGSIEFTLQNTLFTDLGNSNKADNGNIISLLLKQNAKAIIADCYFTNCHHSILRMHTDSDKSNTVTFDKCNFTSNSVFQQSNSFHGLFDLSYMNSVSLSLVSCNFTENYGFCVLAQNNGIGKTTFNNCRFERNFGTQGCIFYVTKNAASDTQDYLIFIDSTFANHKYEVSNTGRATGVLHAPLSFVRFEGTNTFKNNEAGFEGSSTSKQNCAMGGSIFFEATSDKDVIISNIVFEDSTATNYGGAIAVCYESTGSAQIKVSLTFENCQFKKCNSNTGGAVYLDQHDKVQYELGIDRCTFYECDAQDGCSLHCQISKFELSHSVFDTMKGGSKLFNIILKGEGAETKVKNCTFINNKQRIQFSSTSSELPSGSSITFTKCNFSDNQEPESDPNLKNSIFDLDLVQSETINFDECTFHHNGCQCINQWNKIRNVHINKCTFSNNYKLCGCAITSVVVSNDHKMIVENCIFKYNIATEQSDIFYTGCVYTVSNSIDFKGKNTFDHNEVYGSKDAEIDYTRSFGGSLVILQNQPEEYIVSNLEFTNSYSEHYGGAISIFAGDFGEDSDPSMKSAFVRIENCKFNNCSAGMKGGAIKCGMELEDGEWGDIITVCDNDVNISYCTFTNCKAPEGGALYFQQGDEEGDEETVVMHCTFDSCKGRKGSALLCQSYKFELSHTIFKGSREDGGSSSPYEIESFLFGEFNEDGIKAIVTNCTFTDNKQNIEFYSINPAKGLLEEHNSVEFHNCSFTKNNIGEAQTGDACILNLEYINSESIIFENCLFDYNEGRCISQETDVTCTTYVKKCTFSHNTGGRGCCIYAIENENKPEPYFTIEDCIFTDNEGSFYNNERGVVCVDTTAVLFTGVNQFINNKVVCKTENPEEKPKSMGGSLFLAQNKPAEYTLSNFVFTNSHSDGYGGALHIYAGDVEQEENPKPSSLFITLENCTFTSCSAGIQGGAIRLGDPLIGDEDDTKDNDIKIINSQFYSCDSPEGGALYVQEGDAKGDEETVIQYCTFDGCSGDTGSAIYCRSYKFELAHTIFSNSPQATDYSDIKSFIYIYHDDSGIESVVDNCTFYNNEQIIEFVSQFNDISPQARARQNSIEFKQCNFTKNNQLSNFDGSILNLDYIVSDKITFVDCIFEENGGQCIFQESPDSHETHIKRCTFNKNHGGWGCCIYSMEKSFKEHPFITIEDCIFSNNVLSYYGQERGVVCIDTLAAQFAGVNQFINNEVRPDPVEPGTPMARSASLFIKQESPAEYKISNLIFTNSYSNYDGGAIAIYSGDLEGEEKNTKSTPSSLFITIDNCTFTNCSADHQGGAIKCGTEKDFFDKNNNNDIKIINCKFIKCKAPEGGALFFVDGTEEGDEETVIQYSTFDGCIGYSGSAITCRSYKFEMSHSIFCNLEESQIKKPDELYGPEVQSFICVQMNEVTVDPIVNNCTFTNNQQGIVFFVSGAATQGQTNSINFTHCNFTRNSDHITTTGIFDLAYIQSTLIVIEHTIFEENGVPCISQEFTDGEGSFCDSLIKKCTFNNNGHLAGNSITALSSDKVHAITVEDCLFSNNMITTSSIGFYGTIITYSNSIKFQGTNTFENNKVAYDGESTDDTVSTFGGSLTIIQDIPEEYIISNLVIKNSYSSHYGGAIGILAGDYHDSDGESLKHLFVRIENCQFINCTAGKQGGAIRSGLEYNMDDFETPPQFDNDVNISNCKFIKCEAPTGGALYFQDGDAEGDEETIIKYCTFDGCKGSTGSAVFCRSYTLELAHTTFTNSVEIGKVDETYSDIESFLYINHDESGITPNITNCTFTNNQQGVQCFSFSPSAGSESSNSLTFHNCTFRKNNVANGILNLNHVMSDLFTISNCLFEDNSGLCIAQQEEVSCNSKITKCVFNNNHGFGGCAIFTSVSSAEYKITVEDCTFTKNKITQQGLQPGYQGVVVAYSNAVTFEGTNTFDGNEVYGEKDPVNEIQMAFGGSLVIQQNEPEEYLVSNIVFKNSYSQHFGGAMAIFAGDFNEGSDSSKKSAFVRVERCQFTNCTSGKQGGAIRCGLEADDDRNQFDNDVSIKYCTFNQCKAPEAGALYFQDGDEEGDEETVIGFCTFDGCEGYAGSAILCRSYKFEFANSTIKGSRQYSREIEGYETQSFLFADLNEDGIETVIFNCTFIDNEQVIEFYSSNASPTQLEDRRNSITFKECIFTQNNKEQTNGADSLINLEYMLSEQITFVDCKFEDNGGRCISQDSDVISSTSIKRCSFNKNNGGSGCCIYSVASKLSTHPFITVEDCTFSENKASMYGQERGVVCADTLAIQFKGVNTFIKNEAKSVNEENTVLTESMGGSLFIAQEEPAEYTLSNIVFIDSYSGGYGGALHIFSGDLEDKDNPKPSTLFITIHNVTFTNCSAGLEGGAIRTGHPGARDENTKDNDIKITNCTFTKCSAPTGGALYFMDGDYEGDEETVIQYCTFDGCSGSTGSALYCRSYKFEMSHSTFHDSKVVGSTTEESEIESMIFIFLNEAGVNPTISECTFYNNEQAIEFQSHGPIAGEGQTNSVTLTKCNFRQNNLAPENSDTILDLTHIQSTLVKFDQCLFEDNGGKCLKNDGEAISSTHVYKCTFTRNHGLEGCAIFTANSNADRRMTVEDCTFTYNQPSQAQMGHYGCVVAYSNAIEFKGKNVFDHNEIHSPEAEQEIQRAFGGSLVILQNDPDEYTVSGLEIKNSYSQHYGGAISIFAGDLLDSDPNKKDLFVKIVNCKFENCTSGIQGGAIRCGLEAGEDHPDYDNDVNVSHCQFIKCKSIKGGALYFQEGDKDGDEESIVEYCTFDGCIGSTGSAIFCRSYKFVMSHSVLKNSVPYGETTDESETESILFVFLNEAGIEPVVTNCTFSTNEQNIEFQSHGPVAGDGLTSSIKFSDCLFNQNNIQSNGADSILDLQYIQSAQVTFEKCKFEDNYGQCIKQESESVCKTLFTYCLFNGNHGGVGTCIYSATTIEGLKDPLMTVDNCIFSNNNVTSTYGPRGCVYGTTVTIKFTGTNQFVNNRNILQSYDRKVQADSPGFNAGACGAALYLIQENDVEYELKDAIFSNCQSTNYGGAVAIACYPDEEKFHKMFVNIIGCTFLNCQSQRGGSICSTIEGTIKVDRCQFYGSKATEGGDIYVVDDTPISPSSLTVTNSVFSGSQASGDGGAIYCKSGTVSLSSNNFTNCKAGSKGAVMYVSAHSNATFNNNYIEVEKQNGASAIYYTSLNKDSVLYLEGGCYSATKKNQDTSADILVFESEGQIQFKNKPCFAGSKEESVQVIGNQALSLPDEYFNCNECDAIVVPPTPSFTMPTLPITLPPTSIPSSVPHPGETTFYPSDDINGTDTDDRDVKKKSKLGTGAIVGIVIAVLVVVAAIVLLILFILKRRTYKPDVRSEQISQDADNSAYALESHMSTNEDENQPIWAANSMDANNIQENVDPFMKDFEEAVV